MINVTMDEEGGGPNNSERHFKKENRTAKPENKALKKEIWLQPTCANCANLEQSWSEDNPYPCYCGLLWTSYLLNPVQP